MPLDKLPWTLHPLSGKKALAATTVVCLSHLCSIYFPAVADQPIFFFIFIFIFIFFIFFVFLSYSYYYFYYNPSSRLVSHDQHGSD